MGSLVAETPLQVNESYQATLLLQISAKHNTLSSTQKFGWVGYNAIGQRITALCIWCF